MITKNHDIQLKDTSEAEMARFRQIMLGIWRQQIEEDKNIREIDGFLQTHPFEADTHEHGKEHFNTFQKISIDPSKGKLTGSKNLVIFTAENGIDKNKMNTNSGMYDWIAVQNPEDAENILKTYYGDKKRFIENLVWRSHGETGGALLEVSLKISYSDPSKVKALYYIKELLADNANVVFTACSLVGRSLQPGQKYYQEGRNALDKFSEFFVKGSQRNLFLNYTLSSATDETYNSFNFNVGLHKQSWAGFLWLTKDEIKPYFYDVKINSSGGISTQQMKWFMNFSRYQKPLYKY